MTLSQGGSNGYDYNSDGHQGNVDHPEKSEIELLNRLFKMGTEVRDKWTVEIQNVPDRQLNMGESR